jgi:hypothetical protein
VATTITFAARNALKTSSLSERREICEGCGNMIDPDTCGCGDSIDHPAMAYGHAPIPMGCDCGRVKESSESET